MNDKTTKEDIALGALFGALIGDSIQYYLEFLGNFIFLFFYFYLIFYYINILGRKPLSKEVNEALKVIIFNNYNLF